MDDDDWDVLAQIARGVSPIDDTYGDWNADDPANEISDETKSMWRNLVHTVVEEYERMN